MLVKHSANPNLDNCHADYAQRNAKELAEMLRDPGNQSHYKWSEP